jgi:hypothetical protein
MIVASVTGEAQRMARIVRRVMDCRRMRETRREDEPNPERKRNQHGNDHF